MQRLSSPSADGPSRLISGRAEPAGIAVLIAAFTLVSAIPVLAFLPSIRAAWVAGFVLLVYDAVLNGFTAYRLRHVTQTDRDPGSGSALALPSRPSITVILTAHNEAAILPDAIERLLDQSDPPEAILIADDGSTDETIDILPDRYGLSAASTGIVSGAADRIPILRWLRLDHGGKARAFNRAFAFVDTDIVVVLDADTLLDRNALRAMREAFARDDSLVAATGVIEPFTNASLTGRIMQVFQAHEYRRTALMSLAWQQDNALQLIAGAFAGFRRDALLNVGGFDPDSLVEDYDLAHRIHRYAADRALHWRIAIVGEALSYTEAPPTPLSLIQQRRRWFGGFLRVHWLNRDMIGNRRFGLLGTRLMIVKTLDAIQPFVGLTAALSLLVALASGRTNMVVPALIVLSARMVINLAATLWSHCTYRRWTAKPPESISLLAAIAGVVEAWSYRLVRHTGEVWGWRSAFNKRNDWSPAPPTALMVTDAL